MRALVFLGMLETVGRSTAFLLYLEATVAGLPVAKALFQRLKRSLTYGTVMSVQVGSLTEAAHASGIKDE